MFDTRCMAFEISAQELCDIVIEKKVADRGLVAWRLHRRAQPPYAGRQAGIVI
jgi:hypothetical protein